MQINRKEKITLIASLLIIGVGVVLYFSKGRIMNKMENSPTFSITYKENQSKKLKKEFEKQLNNKEFVKLLDKLSLEKLEILKEILKTPEVLKALNDSENKKYNTDKYYSRDIDYPKAIEILNVSNGFQEIEVLSVEMKDFLKRNYPNFDYNKIAQNEENIPETLKIRDRIVKLIPNIEIDEVVKNLTGEQLEKLNGILTGDAELVSLLEFKKEDIAKLKESEENFFNDKLIFEDMKKLLLLSKKLESICGVSPELKTIIGKNMDGIEYKKMASYGEFYLLDKNNSVELEKQYRSNHYTFDSPFIKLNPYGRTPLSAIVKVENDFVGKDVSVTIEGRENSQNYTYKAKIKENGEIEIIGLYPKTKNNVTIRLNDGDIQKKKSVEIETGIINDALPAIVIEKRVDGSIESGMNLVSFNTREESLPFIFDSNGNIRYILIVSPVIKKSLLDRNENGNWEAYDDDLIFEFDMLGKIVNIQDNNRVKLDENWKNGVLFRNNQYLPKKNNILYVYGFSDKVYPSGVFSEIGKDSGNELFKARLYYDKNGFEDNSILSGKRIELFQER